MKTTSYTIERRDNGDWAVIEHRGSRRGMLAGLHLTRQAAEQQATRLNREARR